MKRQLSFNELIRKAESAAKEGGSNAPIKTDGKRAHERIVVNVVRGSEETSSSEAEGAEGNGEGPEEVVGLQLRFDEARRVVDFQKQFRSIPKGHDAHPPLSVSLKKRENKKNAEAILPTITSRTKVNNETALIVSEATSEEGCSSTPKRSKGRKGCSYSKSSKVQHRKTSVTPNEGDSNEATDEFCDASDPKTADMSVKRGIEEWKRALGCDYTDEMFATAKQIIAQEVIEYNYSESYAWHCLALELSKDEEKIEREVREEFASQVAIAGSRAMSPDTTAMLAVSSQLSNDDGGENSTFGSMPASVVTTTKASEDGSHESTDGKKRKEELKDNSLMEQDIELDYNEEVDALPSEVEQSHKIEEPSEEETLDVGDMMEVVDEVGPDEPTEAANEAEVAPAVQMVTNSVGMIEEWPKEVARDEFDELADLKTLRELVSNGVHEHQLGVNGGDHSVEAIEAERGARKWTKDIIWKKRSELRLLLKMEILKKKGKEAMLKIAKILREEMCRRLKLASKDVPKPYSNRESMLRTTWASAATEDIRRRWTMLYDQVSKEAEDEQKKKLEIERQRERTLARQEDLRAQLNRQRAMRKCRWSSERLSRRASKRPSPSDEFTPTQAMQIGSFNEAGELDRVTARSEDQPPAKRKTGDQPKNGSDKTERKREVQCAACGSWSYREIELKCTESRVEDVRECLKAHAQRFLAQRHEIWMRHRHHPQP